jgi:TPR repeat protein
MPALLALVLFSLSPAMEAHSMNNDEPVSGGQIHALDDAQRSDLARKAEAGDAQAAFRLSQYYTFTHADKVQRTRWLAVAAKAGHATAQYNLASELSSDGEDLDQARHWAAEALQNGYKDADRLLGAIEAARSAMLAPDARAALAAKAEAGDAEAAFRLSRYANYVLQDRSQERRWRKLAAEGGQASAQYELAADLYRNGKDLTQAARWAAEARRNGDPDAGRLAQEIEALQSAVLAPQQEAALVVKAEAGDAEAAFRLSKYHHFVHQDGRVGGRRWLVRAAEGGHATAQYNLAAVLQLDGGTLAEAARWAAEARKNGDPDAGRLLQRIEALRAGASRQPGR